jgi:acetyltransferase-like isoleucine patch superfamily enzyme
MIKRYIKGIINQFIVTGEYVLKHIPGYLGILFRRWYWSGKLSSCGKRLFIGNGVDILYPDNISMGDDVRLHGNNLIAALQGVITIENNVFINFGVSITAHYGGEIHIGSDVLIARNVSIIANNHKYDRLDIPIGRQGNDSGVVVIGNDVWIGTNVYIGPHVTIGDGAVVGANAVVLRDVEPYTVVGGVPARFIKKRGDNDGRSQPV